jgi:hypothetical protein
MPTPPRSIVETLFYDVGLALTVITIAAVTVIGFGIVYHLFDVLK